MLQSAARISSGHGLCWGSTPAWAASAGPATPDHHASSKTRLSATAEPTATNLRRCAANCTATSIFFDASHSRGGNTSGLQHSHCASLHCHCPHLRASCEGGSLAQTPFLSSCLLSLYCFPYCPVLA